MPLLQQQQQQQASVVSSYYIASHRFGLKVPGNEIGNPVTPQACFNARPFDWVSLQHVRQEEVFLQPSRQAPLSKKHLDPMSPHKGKCRVGLASDTPRRSAD
mmetsp:Transcript_27918/g.59460  ORF Transcript_27918/g.59460 Transcript_27918/m.59460 type:complete len:102 (+) Transcript_27918:73-378(+)